MAAADTPLACALKLVKNDLFCWTPQTAAFPHKLRADQDGVWGVPSAAGITQTNAQHHLH